MTAAKLLCNTLLILATACSNIGSGLTFTHISSRSNNVGPGRARTHRNRIHPSRSPSWALGGLTDVNDYFASFNATDNDYDNNSDENEVSSSSSKEERTVKHIGHGRIGDSGNGDGDEGGLFNTNNYFSSFGDDIDEPSSSDEQPQSSSTASTPREQPPTRRMTHDEIVAYNNARLCPKNLLTQRAIQTFIYVLEQCRDPHSGKWLEDFLGVPNLGHYHGTGALNVTRYPDWDGALRDLMDQPNDDVIVAAKRRGRGHGGWSKNNPYLQERWVEFRIEIRPASLVQRLLPVRDQLAAEFTRDLDVVGLVDAALMESYFNNLRRVPEASPAAPTAAFDRISGSILSNFTESQDGDSSPLRRGNFDLLYGLCTQAAAHRLLRELRAAAVPEEDVTLQWFTRFYADHAAAHFDGDGGFGRADDFLEALLRAPPALVATADGRRRGLTDPLRVAERLVALRSEVAAEWKCRMGETQEDHATLHPALVRVMMDRTLAESGNDTLEIEEETTPEELSESAGTFE